MRKKQLIPEENVIYREVIFLKKLVVTPLGHQGRYIKLGFLVCTFCRVMKAFLLGSLQYLG